MQWVQDSNKSNIHNLNVDISEDSRHFRNKNKEFPKGKIKWKLTVTQRISETFKGH
jgi:hypothetical protein